MAGEDKESPCRFAAVRLKPRVRAFAREIGSVRDGKDTESVHRMRVASRRLRSALPLFSFCFQERKYRRWMKGLKRIARALGNARDTDVQILFLDRFGGGLYEDSFVQDGIRRIRAFLDGMRQAEQEKIIAAISALEKKGILDDIQSAVSRAGRAGEREDSGTGPAKTVEAVSSVAIRAALSELLSFGPAVHDPDDVTGHHELRIATKKLRYTLEVFRPLYPDRFRPAIRSLKHLQELLGQIHDCDVWIRFLSGQFSGPAVNSGTEASQDTIRPLSPEEEDGISLLLRNRRSARGELYEKLVREWDFSVMTSLKERLPAITDDTGGDQQPSAVETGASAGYPVAPAGLYPTGAGHAKQVTRLALALFDELANLHRLSSKERRILELSGLLHDIGQKGHHIRSVRMILADRTLPVTSRERTIVALVARYHRKRIPERHGRLFSGLSAKDKKRVLMLAALLRIADGLDFTHGGPVRSLSCTIGKEEVTCFPAMEGDGRIERTRALARADLFERVYQRRFVIP